MVCYDELAERIEKLNGQMFLSIAITIMKGRTIGKSLKRQQIIQYV